MPQTQTTKKEVYLTDFKSNNTYLAGFPSYPRNFSRDTLWAGIIAKDEDLLESQLNFSAIHQGKKYSQLSGEEPGKIHHEMPGVSLREPFMTTYNACDTTALFLIALDELGTLNKAKLDKFLIAYPSAVRHATNYLKTHIKDGIFLEYPPAGADKYSLRVTYWKDSVVPVQDKDEPAYPVSYALVQFMTANALSIASHMLEDTRLNELSETMYIEGIRTFIREDAFCVFKESHNQVLQSSSDELHCLRYVPSKYRRLLPIEAIRKRAQRLYTPAGIACTPKDIAEQVKDNYHGHVVWPFEQALIHQACLNFGLSEPALVAMRCIAYIGEGNELIEFKSEPSPTGNSRQLWSVAAGLYFDQFNSA